MLFLALVIDQRHLLAETVTFAMFALKCEISGLQMSTTIVLLQKHFFKYQLIIIVFNR